jgi:ribosome assembly protein YihI (activator of Der GTPase)
MSTEKVDVENEKQKTRDSHALPSQKKKKKKKKKKHYTISRGYELTNTKIASSI